MEINIGTICVQSTKQMEKKNRTNTHIQPILIDYISKCGFIVLNNIHNLIGNQSDYFAI